MEKQNIFYNNGFKYLIKTFLVVLTIFFIFLTLNLGENKENENTISVAGIGEVSARPDVAQISLTVFTENKDLGIATGENNQKINTIISFLKEKSIEDKDIKTSTYNINPRYEYGADYKNRYLAGYEVRQSLIVKIRNLNDVGDIIAGATSRGVNDMGGLSFIIDDDELLKQQAREQAINDAKSKASKLAKDLGISLSEIIGFNESSYSPVRYTEQSLMKSMNSLEDATIAPSIQTGENTITSNITIVYKIK